MGFFNRTSRIGHAAALALSAAFAFAATAASAQEYTMKIGAPTINDTNHNWMKLVKKKLEARTDKITVELYPASQLGAIPQMIEGLQLGSIEAAIIPPEFFSGVDKRYGVLSAPTLLTGIEQGTEAVNDPKFKEVFWDIGEPKGLKLVGIGCDTPTDYATKTPIETLDDLKGKKIRVFGSPMDRAVMDAMGATGVPMPLKEVLPALQQGVIDGNKAAITVFVAFKYFDITPHLLRPRESMICPMKMVSKRWFDSLPGDLQKLLLEVAEEANKENIEFSKTFVENSYQVWKDNGGTIREFSPEEQEAFNERVKDIGANVTADDPEMRKVYEALKAAAERARQDS